MGIYLEVLLQSNGMINLIKMGLTTKQIEINSHLFLITPLDKNIH